MKNLLLLALILFVAGCGNSNKDATKNNKIIDTIDEISPIEIDPISDENNAPPYYIVTVKAVAEKDSAVALVNELRTNVINANYLWIPDYESLSGREFYQVFIGPFDNEAEVIPFLMDYKESNKDAYAILVDHNTDRRAIYSPYDIRQNKKQVQQIFIYAEPEAEDAYYEEGGEDWGWFVGDVHSYFTENHPDVEFYNVYNDILRTKDIIALEKELNPDKYFGYILINGNKKLFIQHDMSEIVINKANEFFGYSR